MNRLTKSPAIIALLMGLTLLVFLPTAGRLTGTGELSSRWNHLAIADTALMLISLYVLQVVWKDAWARSLTIVAIVIAVDAGVDLGQVYHDQQLLVASLQRTASGSVVSQPSLPSTFPIRIEAPDAQSSERSSAIGKIEPDGIRNTDSRC